MGLVYSVSQDRNAGLPVESGGQSSGVKENFDVLSSVVAVAEGLWLVVA